MKKIVIPAFAILATLATATAAFSQPRIVKSNAPQVQSPVTSHPSSGVTVTRIGNQTHSKHECDGTNCRLTMFHANGTQTVSTLKDLRNAATKKRFGNAPRLR